MSKRKPMDKAQARERRNQLLESAASAKLSLTEGVREMRAISGMTQEEFAQHRGVSARVIKAIELGQGNPTVATLNRIGEFFGLEVGFVPVKRTANSASDSAVHNDEAMPAARSNALLDTRERIAKMMRSLQEIADELDRTSLNKGGK
jgi:transcriptional regulator with XRE-family HTH domain